MYLIRDQKIIKDQTLISILNIPYDSKQKWLDFILKKINHKWFIEQLEWYYRESSSKYMFIHSKKISKDIDLIFDICTTEIEIEQNIKWFNNPEDMYLFSIGEQGENDHNECITIKISDIPNKLTDNDSIEKFNEYVKTQLIYGLYDRSKEEKEVMQLWIIIDFKHLSHNTSDQIKAIMNKRS